jgi:hypothetical protein
LDVECIDITGLGHGFTVCMRGAPNLAGTKIFGQR